ncbi:hypothetical protein T4E_10516 [Trichinella pseudospiralis]|uniref:Uncharacterized protein n=1 Tax=Trichinella pseudospiralis TaxID=6337 RepID=A0A0V0XYK9_TRIPS|nr:hypothetical protein T4E_10516 [Trichinella pseudospiralis]
MLQNRRRLLSARTCRSCISSAASSILALSNASGRSLLTDRQFLAKCWQKAVMRNSFSMTS